MEANSRGVDFFCGTQETMQDNAVRACAYVFRYAAANWNWHNKEKGLTHFP